MALPQTVASGQSGHLTDHDEIHELLASMDGYANAAGFASLQAAHDALPAGGGVLYLPPNFTTQPTSQVSITKSCAILGGHGATIQHGGTTGFFDLINVSSAVDGFVLSGVTIDGRYPTRTGGGASLLLNGCSRAWVMNNRFVNSAGFMVDVEGATDVWVQYNRLFTAQNCGVFAGGSNRALDISHNRFHTHQDACIFFMDPGTGNSQQDVTIHANKFRNTQRAGTAGKAAIQTFGNASSSELWFRRFKITDNDIQNDTAPSSGTNDCVGIGLDQIGDSLIANNHVVAPTAGGVPTENIVVCGPRNQVIGNRVENASAGGISLLSYGNGAQIKDCVVANNICRGNNTSAGQGIAIVPASTTGQTITNLIISGNRCFESGHGIQSYNPGGGGTMNGSNILVHGNVLTGNVTGAASFVSGTNATTADNIPTI